MIVLTIVAFLWQAKGPPLGAGHRPGGSSLGVMEDRSLLSAGQHGVSHLQVSVCFRAVYYHRGIHAM